MKENSFIHVRGASTHNLKKINVDIRRNSLVVVTGVSGSGKSSLAFDTIYAESQRRYVESLAMTARRFIPLPPRPDVDLIEGLSPSIALEQKSLIQNPRSTVGTLTDIYDYLRVLFATKGVSNCPIHGEPLSLKTISEICKFIYNEFSDQLIAICSKLEFDNLDQKTIQQKFEELKSLGYSKIRIHSSGKNVNILNLDSDFQQSFSKISQIELVVDRVKVSTDNSDRIKESLELAMSIEGKVAKIVCLNNKGVEYIFANSPTCTKCEFKAEELNTSCFSFNKPQGACDFCKGLGLVIEFDLKKIVKFPDVSIEGGAIPGWDKRNKYNYAVMEGLAKKYNFSTSEKFESLPENIKRIILHGEPSRKNSFSGIVPHLIDLWKKANDKTLRDNLVELKSELVCPVCNGSRLNKLARSVTIELGKKIITIEDVLDLSITGLLKLFSEQKGVKEQGTDGDQIVTEIKSRIELLVELGLQYLTLKRSSMSLSGGEVQRIRLASQIGAKLSGITYVLDEPSKGLHARDNKKLIDSLKKLKKHGNSVIVVEHDRDMMLAADQIIDLGPGAGINGGEILFSGNLADLKKMEKSETAKVLNKINRIRLTEREFENVEGWIRIDNASENNLKKISANFPINKLICVTGVSGSGKSTLINKSLTDDFKNGQLTFLDSKKNKVQHKNRLIEKLIMIDQKAIGKSPKSNPATYTGIYSLIRELFATTVLAREKGYSAGRFSFNNESGRCQKCKGEGSIKIDMYFLPDVYSICEECNGTRFNNETKLVRWRGKNISDVLEMTVEEALTFFSFSKKIVKILVTLKSVGLGYIKLGQSSLTFSGGEAQRIKLARALSRSNDQKTLYLLDEPTTGLHQCEISLLIKVLKRLVDLGHSIITIEHNLEFIISSDWIIDMGPEGGPKGGKIIAEGRPSSVAKKRLSHTGQFIKSYFKA
tara:strand:- start:75 stop:2885 length:2811 start_codon:yes stop_codon:yes gene_type:complete